jgi:hypothetical protein
MAVAQVVDITELRKFIAFTLSATDTFGGALDDPKFGPSGSTLFIDAAILNVDGSIVKAIMRNPRHPKRSAYLAPVAVTNGNLIGEHVGPIGDIKVDSSLAIDADPEDIRRWARDTTVFASAPTGYAGVAGERLFFNGTAATVDLCTYTRTSACQAPSEYTMAEAHLALASIFKQGQQPTFSDHHLKLALLELQDIHEASDFLAAVLKELN